METRNRNGWKALDSGEILRVYFRARTAATSGTAEVCRVKGNENPMVNKKLLKKAVVNAGGVTKFAQGTDVSASTVSRILARDGIVPRLCTASKLQQGIKLYAAPLQRRVSDQGKLTCGLLFVDQFLQFAADLERGVKPEERDGFEAIRERLLQLTIQAEQLELRCNGT